MKKALIIALALASTGMAATVTLTMDEVANQPINGLAVTKGGVTFTFSNTVGNYFYHASNGGSLTYVQDPSLEGETSSATGGAIGVTFSVPVYRIRLGMVLDVESVVAPIGTVSLFSSSVTPFSTLSVNSTLSDPFSEGLFIYNGTTPITNVLITPNAAAANAAAIDNLFIDTAPTPPTPVPTSFMLALAGLVALAFFVARSGFAFGL